jgi:hypothetical protein
MIQDMSFATALGVQRLGQFLDFVQHAYSTENKELLVRICMHAYLYIYVCMLYKMRIIERIRSFLCVSVYGCALCCMYGCPYTHIRMIACMYVCIYPCISLDLKFACMFYSYVYACMHKYVMSCRDKYACIHTAYMNIFIDAHTHTNVFLSFDNHAVTHTHTYTHTCIHRGSAYLHSCYVLQPEEAAQGLFVSFLHVCVCMCVCIHI